MRDGYIALSGKTAELNKDEVITAITPKAKNAQLTESQKLWLELPGHHRIKRNDKPILKVVNLTGEGFKNISFDIYPGESSRLGRRWWEPGVPNLRKPCMAYENKSAVRFF